MDFVAWNLPLGVVLWNLLLCVLFMECKKMSRIALKHIKVIENCYYSKFIAMQHVMHFNVGAYACCRYSIQIDTIS